MLSDLRVHTTIPVLDLDRAMRWYEEKLGFKPIWKRAVGAMYEAGDGTRFQLYPTPNSGQAPQTVMGLSTGQIEADVRELKERGVAFEEYDLPILRTVDSIATVDNVRAAWFRDSEGNILGLAQFPE